jgi:hypothetical protein
MAMPTLEDILRDRIAELENELHEVTNRANEFNAELFNYRQAEEQGLLFKLPCKVGDTLFEPMDKDVMNKLNVIGFETIKGEFAVKTDFGPVPFSCIGKTVFLTREAAEEALKGSGAE